MNVFSMKQFLKLNRVLLKYQITLFYKSKGKYTQFSSSLKILQQHERNDCTFDSMKLPTKKIGEQMPENILNLSNFQKQIKFSFVIYADFESIFKSIEYAHPNETFIVHLYYILILNVRSMIIYQIQSVSIQSLKFIQLFITVLTLPMVLYFLQTNMQSI